jgi:hypothetical protein
LSPRRSGRGRDGFLRGLGERCEEDFVEHRERA